MTFFAGSIYLLCHVLYVCCVVMHSTEFTRPPISAYIGYRLRCSALCPVMAESTPWMDATASLMAVLIWTRRPNKYQRHCTVECTCRYGNFS